MPTIRLLALCLVMTGCAHSRGEPSTAPVATAVASSASSTPKATKDAKGPKWRTIHFDHVDPEKRPQFENARHEWLRALTAAGLSDERGIFLQVGPSTFVTMHAFADFSELDQLQKARRVAPGQLKEAGARYDRDSDDALVPPHHSEVWSTADYLDYRPAEGALDERSFETGYMLVEEVYPGPRGEPYYNAWDEVRPALEKARYPLTRVSFSSSYGSGRVVSLWLSKGRAELAAAPSVSDAIASVLGKEKATAIVEQQQRGLVSTARHELVRRRDLDSPEHVAAR
jgi:hypothetical protein